MLKIVLLASSLVFMSPPIINGILPAIRDSLGLTQAQSEMFLTITSIAILFSVLASNVIIDKIGLKKSVFFGLCFVGIGGMVPVFIQNFTLIIMGRFILGIGLGLMTTPGLTYINILFDEKERASLIGYRASVEQIGRSALTLAAGSLFVFGWNFSFIPYGFALVLAILFYIFVPEIEEEVPIKTISGEVREKEKMPIFIYLTIPFLMMIVLAGAAIDIRFPALAAEAMDGTFNSSTIIAVKPVLGMIFAALFGKIYAKLGRNSLYIGLSGIIVATLLLAFSNGSLVMLTAGFWIGGVSPAFIFPLIMMTISKKTGGKQQRLAMSYIMAAPHISVFLMTPTIEMLQRIINNDTLTAPYPILSAIVLVSMIGVIVLRKKVFAIEEITQRLKVEEELA